MTIVVTRQIEIQEMDDEFTRLPQCLPDQEQMLRGSLGHEKIETLCQIL